MHAPVGDTVARLDVRLVPAALTSWVVTVAGIVWQVGGTLALCSLLVAAASGSLWWYMSHEPVRRSRLCAISRSLLGIGLVGAGFGCAVALRADAVERHAITEAFGTSVLVTVTPSESALSLGRGRMMFRATLQYLRDHDISGRVVVFAPTSDFDVVVAGQPVRFVARINRPTRRDLTVAVLNATGRPIMGQAGLVRRGAHTVRDRFAAAARQCLPTDEAAMLPALVLGDTSAVTVQTTREFSTAGMTHLTAVSGANVTIVCASVLFTARFIGPRAAVALATVALVAFVIVVQPTASVLRAAVMGAIGLAGVLSSRRRQAIPALSATVMLLIAVAPQLAVDIGFALSVVATAALVVVAPIWSRRLVARGWPKPLADALAVVCAAQMVTAPLVAGISGRLSLVSIAANLTVAPVIAPITVLGTAAAVLVVGWPAGAPLLIRFTGPELRCVLWVAHWAAGVPAATVPVPAGVPGALVVGGFGLLVAAVWRWRWVRWPLCSALVAAGGWLLAWSLSGLFGPP